MAEVAEVSNDQTGTIDEFTQFENELQGRSQPAVKEPKSVADEAGSGAAPDAADKETPDSQSDDATPLSPKAQKRFDKITREKYELQRQLDEARKAQPAAKPTESAPAKPAASELVEPNIEDFDGTPGKTFADYQRKLLAYAETKATEKALKALRDEQEADRKKQATQTVESIWKSQQDEARKAHPDHDSIVTDDLEISQTIYRAIREHEQAGELLYLWAKLPDAERSRIVALPTENQQIYETLKLAEGLNGKEKPETTKTQVSKASRPPSKVAGAAAVTSAEESDDFLVFSAAEDAKKRRR